MSLHLRVGPPGAGKTESLLREARDVATEGGRVWWVGLPAQRAHLLRRATRDGPLLGFEPFTLQQLAYRLLADARRLRPLVIGTGRLALVAEALLEVRDEPPNPGEARLFAYAIAEAKRFAVTPTALAGDDAERRRLRAVYAAYERLKGAQVDYDDVRRDALALAAAGPPAEAPDLLVVDGLRELGPLDWRLLEALGSHVDVRVGLPEPPPGVRPDRVLPPRDDVSRDHHRFANPVAEARWVLRSLKRDLAEGAEPLDLAVIVPEREARAFLALADEYGVPMMDETPRALSDDPRGRRLLDLLELPDHPTASRLLAVPELRPLGAAVLERGVAGARAVAVLADELGLGATWGAWLRLLEVGDDPVPWARELLARGVTGSGAPGPEADTPVSDERFRELALRCAQEAQRVASGSHFRAWWAALLQETLLPERPPAGVALVGPTQVSGRRFRRAYLMRAVQGAYGLGEAEDYFVPEEDRAPLARVFARLGLPRRFQGGDAALFAELRARADVLVVSLPEADQAGPRVPEPGLTGGAEPTRPPDVPAGSRLELADGEGHRAPREPLPLGTPTLEALRRYEQCHFRSWAEHRALPDDDEAPWWVEFRRELREEKVLTPPRRAALAERWPPAAAWLREHGEALSRLTFGVRLGGGDGPVALLDAAERDDATATLYRFVGPDQAPDAASAEALLADRWNEWWAAGFLLEQRGRQVDRVRLRVWPIGGCWREVVEGGLARPERRTRQRRAWAAEAERAWRAGDVTPSPGFVCRDCPVFDVCREGRR